MAFTSTHRERISLPIGAARVIVVDENGATAADVISADAETGKPVAFFGQRSTRLGLHIPEFVFDIQCPCEHATCTSGPLITCMN